MPAYVVFTESIHDADGMSEYTKAAMTTLIAAGAKPLAAGPAETIEGDWHGNQTVILQFDTVEAAKAWYNSDEYQAAIPLRQAAADCHAMIISGI